MITISDRCVVACSAIAFFLNLHIAVIVYCPNSWTWCVGNVVLEAFMPIKVPWIVPIVQDGGCARACATCIMQLLSSGSDRCHRSNHFRYLPTSCTSLDSSVVLLKYLLCCYFVVWCYRSCLWVSVARGVVCIGSEMKCDSALFLIQAMNNIFCVFCSGVPCVLCKCVAAVYQQASGHLSHQRREEGKLEEVKHSLIYWLRRRLFTVVCSSCNAL